MPRWEGCSAALEGTGQGGRAGSERVPPRGSLLACITEVEGDRGAGAGGVCRASRIHHRHVRRPQGRVVTNIYLCWPPGLQVSVPTSPKAASCVHHGSVHLPLFFVLHPSREVSAPRLIPPGWLTHEGGI